MKLIIDINQNESGPSPVVQGIKLFMQHAKDIKLTVVGKENDMLTLKDQKNINLIFADKIFEGESDLINDKASLTKAFKLFAKENDFAAIICSYDKDVIKLYADKYLNKVALCPTFISSFPSAYTGKITSITDFGYKYYASFEERKSQIDLALEFEKAVLLVQEPEIKLLTSTSIEHENDINKSVDKYLSTMNNYKGILNPFYTLENNCNLIIGGSEIVTPVASSINEAITIYDEYIKKGSDVSFMYKIGNKLSNSMFSSFHSSIDKKLSSGGTALLGYSKTVVQSNPTTTIAGVKSALEFARKIAYSKK